MVSFVVMESATGIEFFTIVRCGRLTYKPQVMLNQLRVRNFALIEDLALNFNKGFNLLSGETGAGKSLIVDALGLLAGGKASPDVIRTGEESAILEAVFDLPADIDLNSVGIDAEDDSLIVRREIFSGNRNRVYINSQPTTVSVLRSMAPSILDIHGQHEQQTLLDVGRQLALIDRVAQAEGRTQEVRILYSSIQKLDAELSFLTKAESERLQHRDLLQFQRNEIESISPQEGEVERLRERVQILENATKLVQSASYGYEALYESESSVLSTLAAVDKTLAEAARHDSRLESILKQSASAGAIIEDVAYALRAYLQNVDAAPAELDSLHERLSELEKLHRKYGPDLLAHLANVIRELDSTGLAEERKADISRQLVDLRSEYTEKASELRATRHRVAKVLEGNVTRELRSLAMADATFTIRWESIEPSETGVDLPRLFFEPNPGEGPAPLDQIASGGELSRVMLALRTVIALNESNKSLVFDEIDAGIGGEAAERVGEKLRELSVSYQVLCVTHLSQIARFADQHYRIEKVVKSDRTVTRSKILNREERIEELARMMSGPAVTEAARKHVKELLKRQ